MCAHRPVTAPDFLLSRAHGSVRTQGAKETFTDPWDAIDALYSTYDGVKINYPYGKVVFELSNIQMYLDNLSNVYNTYMPRIVFGMMDDPEAYVAEFRAQLKAAGIDMCMQEIQRQLNEVYGK